MKDKVFLKAFWEDTQSALIFLSQDWDSVSLALPLSHSPESIHFDVERASFFDVARLSGYYINGDIIRFLIDPLNYPSLDLDERVYVGGSFSNWQEAIGKAQYQMESFVMDGHAVLILDLPVSILGDEHLGYFRFVTEHSRWLSVPENAPNLVPNRFQGSDFQLSLKQTGEHVFRLKADRSMNLQNHVNLTWKDGLFEEEISISNAEFYLAAKSDLPMGITLDGHNTVFRLFAPRASRVTLEIFKTLKSSQKELYALSKNDDGSWEVVLEGRFDRYFYYYYVDGINYDGSTYFDYTAPIVDPYAKAMASAKGPGIVFSPDYLEPLADGFHPPHWHDLVIAEVHMRDLLLHSRLAIPKSERNQYSGMAKWLREDGNYLKSLGVNAIEFQPLQEFEYEAKDEYHWGYMPVNYFSPSSANEKYPKTGAQMKSLQEMVRATHDAGFACILDVVYNHLGSPNALHAIDKHYYFETDSSFTLTNWSGVGNDIRCRAPMAKRLIIDSLKHLVIQYGVDGFRFDLAELIGRSVLAEIEVELKRIKPSVVLIAEPWSFRGHIAEKLKHTGFSSWNDRYRDFFLSYLKGDGSPMGFEYFVKGSPAGLTRFPAQTVNYSESHDDYCWMDMITENPEKDGSHPTFNDIRRTHLMFSMLFVSLGIPMIAGGQDFLRSKNGIRNTYQRGDINALDYGRLRVYSNSHDYVRNWIAYRLSDKGHLFRLDSSPSESYFKFVYAEDQGRGLAVLFNADKSRGKDQVVYAVNPTMEYQFFTMSSCKMSRFVQLADHMRFDVHGLNSAMIDIQDNRIALPPLSCGLWSKS